MNTKFNFTPAPIKNAELAANPINGAPIDPSAPVLNPSRRLTKLAVGILEPEPMPGPREPVLLRDCTG